MQTIFCGCGAGYDRIPACVRSHVEIFVRITISLAIVAGISVFYRHVLPVNATTIALHILVGDLAVSTAWGLTVAVRESVAAMLSFNF